MFLAGWWVGGWWRGEFAISFVYAAIKVAIALAEEVTSRMAMIIAVSLVINLAAVYLGVLFAGRRGAF